MTIKSSDIIGKISNQFDNSRDIYCKCIFSKKLFKNAPIEYLAL